MQPPALNSQTEHGLKDDDPFRDVQACDIEVPEDWKLNARIAEQGGDASGDAWRMGDLMAEAAQAEELQAATRKTLQHRLHVAKLVKDRIREYVSLALGKA
eukprot:s701_g12.t1